MAMISRFVRREVVVMRLTPPAKTASSDWMHSGRCVPPLRGSQHPTTMRCRRRSVRVVVEKHAFVLQWRWRD